MVVDQTCLERAELLMAWIERCGAVIQDRCLPTSGSFKKSGHAILAKDVEKSLNDNVEIAKDNGMLHGRCCVLTGAGLINLH